MSAVAQSRAARVTAALLVVGGAAVVWWLARAPAPEATPPSAAATTTSALPAASPAATAAPTAAAKSTPAAAATRSRVQQRLDAIASAYVAGDARAIEAALWPNHVVIRPDGERLDRRALLQVWGEEWAAFTNRDLKFYVEDVIEEGDKATVVWAILLTAEVPDANGDEHHLMINGKQQATVVRAGDVEMLDGPIEYAAFERTLDGNPWPLD